MRLVTSYMFRQFWGHAVLLAVGLSLLILMAQSMRFLDLMIAAGAGPVLFFQLLLLSLPRLIDTVLPIATGIGVMMVSLRLVRDREWVAMLASGASPARLMRPVLILGGMGALLMMLFGFWISPASLAKLQTQQHLVQKQFSFSLLQTGVFSFFGEGMMVYAAERTPDGRLLGLMIHDTRNRERPVTIMAQSGTIGVRDDLYQLTITDGQRQSVNPATGSVESLSFNRYTITLPRKARQTAQRWKEPDERTMWELWRGPQSGADADNAQSLRAELHRRIAAVFLPLSVAIPIFMLFALRPVTARQGGQILNIAASLGWIALLFGGFLGAFAAAQSHDWLVGLLYLCAIGPAAIGIFMLYVRDGAR